MSPEFDPYHKWLGIPPAEQPPHHYRLLGLAVFEHDEDVIEIAADQRMALLRSFHTGPHSDLSQKLLNEVAAARLCLLRPDRRQRYDEGLRQRLATAATQAAPAAKPAPAAPAPAPAKPTPAAAAPFRSDFDLLDDLPGSKPATTPLSAAKSAATGAGLSGIGKSGPTSPGQSGIGKSAPAKNNSIELLGKAAKRAQSDDELELVGKTAKKPQEDTLQLAAKTAKKSREIELSPRSSAWDQAIADACSTQSVVHRRRRRWHIDIRVIQFILFIAFVAGLGYAGSVGYQMWQDYEFKQSNKVAKSKSTPAPPTTATTTTNAQTATTATDTTDETDVRPAPVGPQPAFGGGRTFVNEPSETESSQPRPNETNPNPNPSNSRPGGSNYPSQTGRFPIPSAEEQKRKLEEMNEVYKNKIRQAVGLVNQDDLARYFAQVAADTKEPAMKYVIANQSLETAIRLGDVELASRVVGGLAANFEVNGWELKFKTLGQLARAARSPAARAQIVRAAFGMVEEALADGHFDNAQDLATLSLNLSAKDPAMREQARLLVERVKFIQKQTKAVEEANSRLAADPEDRSANLVVGKFQCFVKQDWDGGLAHLAKGADDILRTLAERDQRRPTQAEQQIELADAWWTLADQRTDPKSEIESKGLRSRAVFWYRKAMPGLSGFPLEKARERSADAP